MKKILVIVIISVFALHATSTAQVEPIKLLGRHTLSFEGGAKTNSNTSVVTNASVVEAKTGFIGDFNYGYWFDNEWSLTLSAGIFGAETSINYSNVETNAIIPILFGIRYYPEKLSLGSVGRFYAGLALGEYIGFATKTKNAYSTETVSESVFGGQVSVGVDLFISSWFKLGPKLSYHFLGNYGEIIGTTKNLSGASFSLEAGFVL